MWKVHKEPARSIVAGADDWEKGEIERMSIGEVKWRFTVVASACATNRASEGVRCAPSELLAIVRIAAQDSGRN